MLHYLFILLHGKRVDCEKILSAVARHMLNGFDKLTHIILIALFVDLQAGIDCVSMRKNSKMIYNTYRHGALPDMKTQKAYDVFRRLMSGETELITELLSYFNKGTLSYYLITIIYLMVRLLTKFEFLSWCRPRVFVVIPKEHAVQRRLLWPRRISPFPRRLLLQRRGG